ncbi:polyprenyl synthetase family protein [Candidatus Hakubella thermalkaliphila]|uniref:Octaprenyl-diphosphate synthase n=1 Tax=Candidatus Hakubella thermalkaliphila TaxID=2754717 RepID=A0A6V8P7B7_9ACTN|nr:polyprenyl synthetase family protein [Candidatus Hakubella thermalkaliphila]GFP26931.1 octaprenyl-diphosphate synthase [Candidatus Hakubella thermalkaliphila]
MREDIPRLTPLVVRAMAIVEGFIQEQIDGFDRELGKVAREVLSSGGKRLRPMLVLVSGLAGDFEPHRLKKAAAALEFFHNATLVHDDVIDEAKFRRGRSTVFSQFGEKLAALVGDFLFSQTFILLSSYQDVEVLHIMSETGVSLAVGELAQLRNLYQPNLDEQFYLKRARDKTASLFSSACKIGATICGASSSAIQLLGRYGESLGIAFQIFDDILDIEGKTEITGKPVGSDIRDGIVTLPLIYAFKELEGKLEARDRIMEIFGQRDPSESEVREVIGIIRQTRALSRAKEKALGLVQASSEIVRNFQNQELRSNLESIGKFVVNRYN